MSSCAQQRAGKYGNASESVKIFTIFVTSLEDGYLPYQVSYVINCVGFILSSVIVIVFHLFSFVSISFLLIH